MGRGRRGEGNGPVGMSLLVWAGASPFHTGGCATRAALLPSCKSQSPGGCSEPAAARSGSSHPSLPGFSSIRSSLYSLWILYYIERGRERGGTKGEGERGRDGRGGTERTTQRPNNFSCSVPKKAGTSMTKLVFHKRPPAWAPQLCSWSSLHFLSK